MQDENSSFQVIASGAWTYSRCFGELERQEGAHLHSWQAALSTKRQCYFAASMRFACLSHCYAPLHHLCPPLCPVTPFLSRSSVLFELPATGHSPMSLCWVLFHGIHIALGKGESLGKWQQILSHTFSCLSFLITFSEYILQGVWDLSPTICCSFSLVL